jgi:hypothetical protein
MSHRFISENPDLIKNLLYILPHLPASGSRILQVADLYIDEKQSRELAITAQKSAETKEEKKGSPLFYLTYVLKKEQTERAALQEF